MMPLAGFAATLLILVAHTASAPQPASPAAPVAVTDVLVQFVAADGTRLEGKLTIPAAAKGPVPVVFHLHGAGPMNYDHPLRYKDREGAIQTYRYYDFYSQELARRGVAFFRMSKRGCSLDATGGSAIDRSVFSKATPTILLGDY